MFVILTHRNSILRSEWSGAILEFDCIERAQKYLRDFRYRSGNEQATLGWRIVPSPITNEE